VERLLGAVDAVKHRAIVATAYGAGLRITEACSLQVGDIDSPRGLLHVRDGKRGRDRYVMLFQSTTARLIEKAGLPARRQRQDSTHVLSNIKLAEATGVSCGSRGLQRARPPRGGRTKLPRPAADTSPGALLDMPGAASV
jgi:integrase